MLRNGLLRYILHTCPKLAHVVDTPDVNVGLPVFFLHDLNDMMFPCTRFIDFVAVIVEYFAIGPNSNLRGCKLCEMQLFICISRNIVGGH